MLILKYVMLAMFIIIDIYSLRYDIMKRHICQCVCPAYYWLSLGKILQKDTRKHRMIAKQSRLPTE